MCIERHLPRTGSKTILIQRLVGYYFTNLDTFESDFEGMYEDFGEKWEKAKERMRDEELSARAILAAGPKTPPPCVSGFRVGFLALVWHVKKLGAFPRDDDAKTPIFELCGLQYDATRVL